MNKVTKIIKREYLTRVRKKSFVLMTILGPILFAALIASPILISKIESGSDKTIAVIDSSGIFDYTKILHEVTDINTKQLYKDILELNPKAVDYRHIFTEMESNLFIIITQRDTNLAQNMQTATRNVINKLNNLKILTQHQTDSINHRYTEYYDLLIKEFESVRGKIPDEGNTRFTFIDMSFDKAKELIISDVYHSVIFIPQNILSSQKIQIISKKSIGLSLMTYIRTNIERSVENQKMIEAGISHNDMNRIKTKIQTNAVRITDDGQEKENRPELAMIVGYVFGFIIYMAIFMFGSLIMRGVIEEKSNRIVEIILSSVKPIQLLAGKIVGVGLVGITQFALWVVLTFALVQLAAGFLTTPNNMSIVQQQAAEIPAIGGMQTMQPQIQEQMPEITAMFNSIESLNIPLLLSMFLFFFLGGYLLYAALFAAVGSAVDNEADTQQFMLPITIPLIIAIIAMISVINNPEGNIAYWFSIIPFTSPVVMLVRIPFGVPFIDLVISATLLILTIIATIWVGAKIYSTGILMYGSKITYKDLWKWLRQ